MLLNFDTNLSNIEYNYDFINKKNNRDIFPKNKKWQFSRYKNYQNISGNNINDNNFDNKNDFCFNNSFENYKLNNNIFDTNYNNFILNKYKSQKNEKEIKKW